MSSWNSDRKNTAEDVSTPQSGVAGEKQPEQVSPEQVSPEEVSLEEVSPDTFIETLLEEILNDWNDGPFVHRLKAYETPTGQIVIREERIKISQGTTVELAPFAGCAFNAGYGSFTLSSPSSGFIEIARNKSYMKTGNCTFNNMGQGLNLSIANKAICTNFNDDEISYDFQVRDKIITYTCNESNSSSAGNNVRGFQTSTVNFGRGQVFNIGMPGLSNSTNTFVRQSTRSGNGNTASVTNNFSGARFNSRGGKVSMGNTFISQGDMYL